MTFGTGLFAAAQSEMHIDADMSALLAFLHDFASREEDSLHPPLQLVGDVAPATPPAEAALLSRLHASDESALAELFTQHYTHLCSYAYKLLGSADLAESAVLDVMTSLWNRRETLRIHGTFRSYLTGAVRLRALHIARSQRLTESWTERTAVMAEPMAVDNTPLDPETAAIHNDLNRILWDAVATLPPRCHEVFELAWYGGLTYAEIAAQLGISVKGVEAQMTRAYRTLRAALVDLI